MGLAGEARRLNARTAADLITENVPRYSAVLYTDEWQSYRGGHPAHATVRHGVHAWAREMRGTADARSIITPVEGAGAALRTSLRVCRGVHKQYLHLYVATHEVMLNTTRVTPQLIRRMGARNLSVYTGYT